MNDPKSILDELKKAVVGKDNVLIMALLAILSRVHILLEDIPGVERRLWRLLSAKRWDCSITVCSLRRMYFLPISLAFRFMTR